MNPDYTEAKTFENLPEGDYRFQVDKGVAGESKNTGTKLVAWDLRVIEHEKLNGASLTHRTFLTGAASGFLKSFLKTMTPDYEEGPFDTQTYAGKILCGRVAHEDYQGKTYAKLKQVWSADSKEENDIPF